MIMYKDQRSCREQLKQRKRELTKKICSRNNNRHPSFQKVSSGALVPLYVTMFCLRMVDKFYGLNTLLSKTINPISVNLRGN